MTLPLFVVKRLLVSIPLIVVASIVVFISVSVIGDPLDQYRKPGVPPETLAAKAKELGLDQPLLTRYLHWISGVLHGDFGQSLSGNSVNTLIANAASITVRLAVLGIVLTFLAGVFVGTLAAVRRGNWVDKVLVVVTVILMTAPEFWIAAMVKQLTIDTQLRLDISVLPTVGPSSTGMADASFWERMIDYGSHSILPMIVLVLSAFPILMLYQRSALVDVLDSDYLLLAKAKGLSKWSVVIRHGLRNALLPVITTMGLRLAQFVTGLVVIEVVFSWPGMGRLLVDSMVAQDTNVVLALLLIIASLVTVGNLMADISQYVLDPKVRNARE